MTDKISPYVAADRNGHTAIVFHANEANLQVMEMCGGQITTRRMRRDEYEGREFRAMDYPIVRAAAKYLRHEGGVSEAARRELEKLIPYL